MCVCVCVSRKLYPNQRKEFHEYFFVRIPCAKRSIFFSIESILVPTITKSNRELKVICRQGNDLIRLEQIIWNVTILNRNTNRHLRLKRNEKSFQRGGAVSALDWPVIKPLSRRKMRSTSLNEFLASRMILFYGYSY